MKIKYFYTFGIILIFVQILSIHAELQWKIIGNLTEPRYTFRALPVDNSRILVIGGQDNYNVWNTCNYIDMNSLTISSAPPMNVPRAEFQALYTKDSNIVVLSGVTDNSNATTTAVELFDRKKETWTVIGNLNLGRRQYIAFFINDSEIVVAGGYDYSLTTRADAEIFNMNTGVSTDIVGYPYAINSADVGVSSIGEILILGGRSGGVNSFRSNEVYKFDRMNPSYWVAMNPIPETIQHPSEIKLWNGHLLVSGGSRQESPLDFTDNIILENNSNFTSIAKMKTERQWHEMAQFSDDSIMIAGGYDDRNVNMYECNWLILSKGTIIEAPMLNDNRRQFQLVSMPYSKNITKRTVIAIAGGDTYWTKAISSVEMLVESCFNQPFYYTDFANTSELNFIGNTRQVNNVIRLTDTRNNLSGAAWFKYPLPIDQGFTTSFSFKLSQGDNFNCDENSLPGADGIAFVMQASDARSIGFAGGGIGYDGIPNSVAVEYDTFDNDSLQIENFYDPNGNHIAVQSLGMLRNSSKHNVGATLGLNKDIMALKSDGTIYYSRIDYSADSKTLELYLDTVRNFSSPVLKIDNFDLQKQLNLIENHGLYLGFTSGTGCATENHDILDWNICLNSPQGFVSVKESNETSQMEFFPNPVTDFLGISGMFNFNINPRFSENINIEIFSVEGIKMLTLSNINSGNMKIDVSKFLPGVYFIKIGDKVKKFVKI